MECVTASQSSNIIVLLDGINANSTRITWICQKLGRHSSVNVVIFLVVFLGIGDMLVDSACRGWNRFQLILLLNRGCRNTLLGGLGIHTLASAI
jgi:hypothetical protein